MTDQHVRQHTCSTCAAGGRAEAMSEEQFSDLVAMCNKELAVKQDAFMKRIEGLDKWFYHMDDLSLTFGEKRFAITPIGTYSASYQSWMWAWANDEFPEIAREASKHLQQLYDLTGWDLFRAPGLPASSADAQIFTSLAVHILDAIGFFKNSENDGPTIYLAVHERI